MVDKKRWYSLFFLICVAIILNSFPLDLFFKNAILNFSIGIALKIAAIIFIFYYSKKESFTIPTFAKPNKKHLLFIPFLIAPFSNFFVVILCNSTPIIDINYQSIVFSFVNCALISIIEEMLFRCILLPEFEKVTTPFKAILYTSLIFGGMHLLNISSLSSIPICLVQSIYTFGLGLVLGLIYIYGKNIIYPIIYHLLFNFLNNTLVTGLFNLEWNITFYLTNIFIAIILIIYGIYVYYILSKEAIHATKNMDF